MYSRLRKYRHCRKRVLGDESDGDHCDPNGWYLIIKGWNYQYRIHQYVGVTTLALVSTSEWPLPSGKSHRVNTWTLSGKKPNIYFRLFVIINVFAAVQCTLFLRYSSWHVLIQSTSTDSEYIIDQTQMYQGILRSRTRPEHITFQHDTKPSYQGW